MLYRPETVADSLFYLKPKKNWSPGDNIWFEKTPIGHNLLNTRFKKMCGEAGLVGNFTNHSSRATAITRMYDAGLPEKSIMQRSGHRSVEGVRAYQREDPNNKLAVSNVLSCSKSGLASCIDKTIAVSSSSSVSKKVDLNMADDDDLMLAKACDDYEKNISVSNIRLDGIFQGANLQNVTINININK